MQIEKLKGTLIQFTTKDQKKLDGFLVNPKNSKSCIIHIHGMTGNFYGHHLHRVYSSIAPKKGFAVFLLNTRGHDRVSGLYSTKKRHSITSGTYYEKFEESAIDIESAISMLLKLGFRNIILSGHSTGCQKVAYYQYKKKDKRVKALVLLAPADDYNSHKKDLGRRFNSVVKLAQSLVKKRKGDIPNVAVDPYFTPKRFLSVTDLKNPEARIFDYEGDLREFSSITVPVCAIFGSGEEFALKPVAKYLNILDKKTNSRAYLGVVVEGASHSFTGYEAETAEIVTDWLQKVLK